MTRESCPCRPRRNILERPQVVGLLVPTRSASRDASSGRHRFSAPGQAPGSVCPGGGMAIGRATAVVRRDPACFKSFVVPAGRSGRRRPHVVGHVHVLRDRAHGKPRNWPSRSGPDTATIEPMSGSQEDHSAACRCLDGHELTGATATRGSGAGAAGRRGRIRARLHELVGQPRLARHPRGVPSRPPIGETVTT